MASRIQAGKGLGVGEKTASILEESQRGGISDLGGVVGNRTFKGINR